MPELTTFINWFITISRKIVLWDGLCLVCLKAWHHASTCQGHWNHIRNNFRTYIQDHCTGLWKVVRTITIENLRSTRQAALPSASLFGCVFVFKMEKFSVLSEFMLVLQHFQKIILSTQHPTRTFWPLLCLNVSRISSVLCILLVTIVSSTRHLSACWKSCKLVVIVIVHYSSQRPSVETCRRFQICFKGHDQAHISNPSKGKIATVHS